MKPIREIYATEKDALELQEQLPYKPYSTSDFKKYGQHPRKRKQALKCKYIQMNPPCQIVFLTFDLDYDAGIDYRCCAPFAVTDKNLPLPMWCVINPKNGHSHLIYVLKTPVVTGDNAHPWPLKYLAAIERAFREKLGADLSYSGLTSKNPWCKDWIVYKCGYRTYTLQELACSVESVLLEASNVKPTRKNREGVAGLGRNCYIFETVRIWSYRAIRRYWDKDTRKPGAYAEWRKAVLNRCLWKNSEFTTPLSLIEVKHIAKSISRWTWRKLTPEGFSEVQRQRVKKRWDRQKEHSPKERGIELLKEGCTVKEVSEKLGVPLRTCYDWKRLIISPKREIILPEEPRGATEQQRLKGAEEIGAEEISERTFYRCQGKDDKPTLSEIKPLEAEKTGETNCAPLSELYSQLEHWRQNFKNCGYHIKITAVHPAPGSRHTTR